MRSDYAKGVPLTLLGALTLTFDTLLLRLAGTDPWNTVFWRGIFMFAAVAAFWLLARRRIAPGQGLVAGFVNGASGLVIAATYGGNAILFLLAISYTSVAHLLFLFATAPLFAALLSLVFLRESVPLATWLAIVASTGGILLVVEEGLAQGSWLGDVLALAAAATMGAIFVGIRHTGKNMFTAPAVGGLASAAVALPWVESFALDGAQLGYLALDGALVMPVALGLMAIGPRYLPAPQVSLFLLLETVLGPLWVWLALGESTSAYSILGGAVVVATLALHSAYFLFRGR